MLMFITFSLIVVEEALASYNQFVPTCCTLPVLDFCLFTNQLRHWENQFMTNNQVTTVRPTMP
jgi:hypothetical protein